MKGIKTKSLHSAVGPCFKFIKGRFSIAAVSRERMTSVLCLWCGECPCLCACMCVTGVCVCIPMCVCFKEMHVCLCLCVWSVYVCVYVCRYMCIYVLVFVHMSYVYTCV